MSILISHNSALERLRAVPPQCDRARITQSDIPLDTVVPSRGEVAQLDPHMIGIERLPVHHLQPIGQSPRSGHYSKSHRFFLPSIPADLVREITPGIYTCGPELCFIQMAATMSLLGAVVLGYELCGTYSHFAAFVSGFYERPALTSVNKIQAAIDRLDGMNGVNRAREALRWVRDGSASPMETVVACMLRLPCEMGGFGLVAPELNYRVDLTAEESRITGTKECRIDTGYPSVLVGVEFDGASYHRDVEKDRRRREALIHHGWNIYVFNVDEVCNYQWFKDKVALLDEVPRQSRTAVPSEDLGRDLLARLLKATRFGLGLSRVLFGVDVSSVKIPIHL